MHKRYIKIGKHDQTMGIIQSKQQERIDYKNKTVSGTRGNTEKDQNKSKF